MTFSKTKTSFKRNLRGVNSAFLSGNEFWFDPAQYGQDPNQNLHVDFYWGKHRFFLTEKVGCTNGGASWATMTITKHGSNEAVYNDHCHDGNGAWQTGDGSDARCEYSNLTKYILKVLRSYVD